MGETKREGRVVGGTCCRISIDTQQPKKQTNHYVRVRSFSGLSCFRGIPHMHKSYNFLSPSRGVFRYSSVSFCSLLDSSLTFFFFLL